MVVRNTGAPASSPTRRPWLRTLLVGCALATGTLAAQAWQQDAEDWNGGHHHGRDGPVVRTDGGWLRGFQQDGVARFLGIPYAAPPVGELRWRPPAPAQGWHGLRDATEYGNICAQVTTLGVFAGPASVDEDCLYLNVFTTAHGGKRGGSKRPVLVWIHGGGNVDGASNDYDGSKLATGGPLGVDTVVVTTNYRLGLLGFLAHPALNAEGHPFANYGIMDLQAVLRWVKANIASFGGDPGNVTLGGQSAGASDTSANLISPMSKGLFHRAILQSSPTSTYPPLSLGLERGTKFAAAAGCANQSDVAACLRKLSVAEVLQWQGTANANGPYVTGPMVDGTVIPRTPLQAWTSGDFNRMPVMGGNTRDEATFGIGITEYFTTPQAAMTADDFNTLVTRTYSGPSGPGGSGNPYPPGTVDAVLSHYPLASYPSPMRAYDALSTDSGACRALLVEKTLSKWVPFYAYQFNYQDAPYYFPPMPDFQALAAHTIDIQFLFPLWHGGILGVAHPLNAGETTLSDQLVGYWTKFAHSGNPNGSGDSPWPRFQPDTGPLLLQNVPSSSTTSADAFSLSHQCEFWNTVLVY
jgi:para-nitrobenzyl esterase